MRRSILLTFFAAGVAALGACQSATENKPVNVPNAVPSPVASPAVSPSVDPKNPAGDPKAKLTALEGKWPGAEGTYLNITKKGDKYSIEIKGLDKAETFEGTAKGDTIEFQRKGKTETIRAASGDETGVKSLAGEKNCVVITKGSEGFCRK